MSQLSNYFDYFAVSVVLISTLVAFVRGFVKSFVSLLVWIGALFLSYACIPLIEPYIVERVSSQTLKDLHAPRWIAGFIGFVGAVILLSILSLPVVNMTRKVVKGFLDRTLGFAFGVVRGVAFVCVVFISIALADQVVSTTDTKEVTEVATEVAHGKVQESVEKAKKSSKKMFDAFLAENSKPVGPEWLQKSKSYQASLISSRILVEMLPADAEQKVEAMLKNMKGATEDAVKNTADKAAKIRGPKAIELEIEDNVGSVIKAIPNIKIPTAPEAQETPSIDKNNWQNPSESAIEKPASPSSAGASAVDEMESVEKLFKDKQ